MVLKSLLFYPVPYNTLQSLSRWPTRLTYFKLDKNRDNYRIVASGSRSSITIGDWRCYIGTKGREAEQNRRASRAEIRGLSTLEKTYLQRLAKSSHNAASPDLLYDRLHEAGKSEWASWLIVGGGEFMYIYTREGLHRRHVRQGNGEKTGLVDETCFISDIDNQSHNFLSPLILLSQTRPGGRPQYLVTQLWSYSLTDTSEIFRPGAIAFWDAERLNKGIWKWIRWRCK